MLKRWIRGCFRNDIGRTHFRNWEWLVMRILFAPALWLATWSTWDPRTADILDFEDGKLSVPNGLASLIDLSWLSASAPTLMAAVIFLLLLVLYLSGRLPLLATGGLFLIHWAVGSVANSPAGNDHATQVVGMVLLGQFAFFLWHTVWGQRTGAAPKPVAHGAIFISQQMIVASYLVAGIFKLVRSGGGWIAQIPNIGVQFSKNLDQKYYDHLVPPEGAAAAMNQWAINFVTESPTPARLLFGSGLVLELFAILALLNRRLSLAMGLALLGMHESISKIMQLNFGFNKWLLLVFFVNAPFWIWWALRGRRER